MKTTPDGIEQRKVDTAVLAAVQEPVKRPVVVVVQEQVPQTLASELANTKQLGQYFLMRRVLTDTDCFAEETIYLVSVAFVLVATVTNSYETVKWKQVTPVVGKAGFGKPRDYDTNSLMVGTMAPPE